MSSIFLLSCLVCVGGIGFFGAALVDTGNLIFLIALLLSIVSSYFFAYLSNKCVLNV